MDDKIPFTSVMKSLKDDEQVSIPLLYRFSDMAPDEWEHLQAVWPTLAEERRAIIARHLADISEVTFAVDFSNFFTMGLNDPVAAVRLAALDGLWDSERISLIQPIIAMMQNDPSEEVRARAAGTLGQFVVRGEWEIIPLKSTRPIVDALLAQMDDPKTTMAVRRATLEALGAAYHPRVAELITAAYNSGKYEMQVSAVCAMGNSGDKQWTAQVMDELEHPDAEMRFIAARAAGQIGSSDLVSQLTELLEDEDVEVKFAAIASLGEIGGRMAQEALEDLQQDPEVNEEVLEAVEEALDELFMLSGLDDLSLIEWGEDDDDFDEEENGNWLPFKGEA